jgi:hypothetical protein
MGVTMIGPTLLEYGNEEQKLRHLPKIARGEVAWCQGYSEPGAGSDLASLKTRAEDKGDYYLVNGSKIWTSGAQHADWIFCLVRTDPNVPKHDGISFVLFSMDDPGVTVKPIELINGQSPFCQTFFDNVRVPKADLVHEENRGWMVAKRLLQHERSGLAALASADTAGPLERIQPSLPLPELARHYCGGQRIDDPLLRADLIDNEMRNAPFCSPSNAPWKNPRRTPPALRLRSSTTWRPSTLKTSWSCRCVSAGHGASAGRAITSRRRRSP